MKKTIMFILALVMIVTSIPALVSAEDAAATYSDHLTDGSAYDLTGSNSAWVKQATGVLIWVVADDARDDDEIIAQAKNADPSLANAVSAFAVLKGIGSAETPNANGSKALVTVSEENGATLLSIEGNYSHFVKGYDPAAAASAEPATQTNTATPAEPAAPANTETPAGTVSIRIDTPLKMAVAFADGTVYYGGEMKDVVVGQEYMFRMCSVNWDNGIYDENGNGIAGTVVYRMIVVHHSEFFEYALAASQDPDRYTVKGMDVIDNEAKTIIINCDATDAHLETDVNNFFVAYRFHFANGDYNKKTGIENVINNPLESLSVNLPAGSTIACNAYVGDELIDNANVFVTVNSGEGVYDDVYLTSVNDFTWNA